MLNIDRALGDDRLIKAITGFYASEFNKPIERFREEIHTGIQIDIPCRMKSRP
jgi:hypothetical protein